MKKIIKMILFTFAITIFSKNVNAATFYLGEKVPDIYIYMNRIDYITYRQFRMIYKSGTNELVYCIEPGTTIASGEYEETTNYDSKFNISSAKWERIKKIAEYGYLYKDHTDIKWYAITQYMIWKEVMPDNWQMYFVSADRVRLDNQFEDEINEINNLVNFHIYKPYIKNNYIFNYDERVLIDDRYNLLNYYKADKGTIKNNQIDLTNEVKIGDNKINLKYNSFKPILFHYNNDGQNIMTKGTYHEENISFNVHITAGKLNVIECEDENKEQTYNKGVYEILDQDNSVVDTISCKLNEKCESKNLPIGNYGVKVKSLSDKFEKNEHIYDAIVKDDESTDVYICSERITKEKIVEKEIVKNVEKVKTINNDEEEDYKIVDIPYTYKNSYKSYIILLILISFSTILLIKNVKNNE